MIRFLDLTEDTEYIKQAKKLWKSAFSDSKRFIDFYFEHRSGEGGILCCIENDRVVSMLHIVDVISNKPDFRLITGVATDKKYRNRGYAGKLLDYIHDLFPFMSFILQPHEEWLWGFYEKHGYRQLCTYYLLRRKNGNGTAVKKGLPSVDFVNDVLGNYIDEFDTFIYSQIDIAFFEADNGEGFFAYTDRAFAFCTEEGDTCKALYVSGDFSEELFRDICAQTACENIEILLAKKENGAKPVPFNMICTDRDVKEFGSIFSNLYY